MSCNTFIEAVVLLIFTLIYIKEIKDETYVCMHSYKEKK